MQAIAFNPPLPVDAAAAVPAAAPARHSRRYRLLRWLLPVLVVGMLLRIFVGEASLVPTASMEGTILVGDHIFLNKAFYGPNIPWVNVRLPRLKQIRRGEIVAFRSPIDPNLTYLKRVVAVGGDEVEIRRGVLHVNGQAVNEPYVVHSGRWRRQSIRPRTVPPQHLFMLGDNRERSNDSRDFGSVHADSVIGEPVFVYWSYDAPSEQWLQRDPRQRLRFYASVVANFFSRTRWARTGTLVE